ncbi:IS630 family transposase [Victivallis sp. Marseille-Q1083]|uniref:IS630 family transposase n=1 Tax=Victivallis sp. Marseille-Q1083 TaxID=2717288 RepID=UPI00158B9AE3|nr:IS630 family transposase [Victivallis sp. Marseille-Q1083]
MHVKISFGIEIPVRTLGEYLKRWGFAPQKPVKKAYQRNEAHVQKWLIEEYPRIKKLAKSEDADIFWGDETGIRNDEAKGRSYAPKGNPPVQAVNPVREKVNMISAITNQGKTHFMFYSETMTVQLLIQFMERLIHQNERKVYLILDNLRVHHSKTLTGFLQENAAFIKLFFLPSYSPDLNPDEYLNRDLKIKSEQQALGACQRKNNRTCQATYGNDS